MESETEKWLLLTGVTFFCLCHTSQRFRDEHLLFFSNTFNSIEYLYLINS